MPGCPFPGEAGGYCSALLVGVHQVGLAVGIAVHGHEAAAEVDLRAEGVQVVAVELESDGVAGVDGGQDLVVKPSRRQGLHDRPLRGDHEWYHPRALRWALLSSGPPLWLTEGATAPVWIVPGRPPPSP